MKKELKVLLLDYKLSPNNLDLQNAVIKEAESILIATVNHFKKFYFFIDFEEVLNIARLLLLDAIKAFLFYCPYCSKIALNERAFQSHLIKFHPDNNNSLPAVPVDKFVCYYIGSYLQVYLKKEKRINSRLTEFSDTDEELLIDNDEKIDKVVINDLIEKIIPKLTKRQRIIVKGMAKGKLQKEVAKTIKKKEGLKSLDSAIVIVNRELKELKSKHRAGELL